MAGSPRVKAAIVRPSEAASAGEVDLCIVIDVLRATTTATILCERLDQIALVRTPAELGQLPARAGGYALFSELAGVESELRRFDNSPVQARTVDLDGQMPVLVTTNGTLAIGLAAQLAKDVVLAAFVNLSAVIEYARAGGAETVAIMPAGNINKGKLCIEDDRCADAIFARLTGAAFDVPDAIAACRRDARIMERRAKEPNLGADIELCFDVDAVTVVPRVAAAGEQRWFDVMTMRS